MLAKRFWLNHAKDMVQRDWKNDTCLAFCSWKNLTLLLCRGRPRNIKTWFRAIFFSPLNQLFWIESWMFSPFLFVDLVNLAPSLFTLFCCAILNSLIKSHFWQHSVIWEKQKIREWSSDNFQFPAMVVTWTPERAIHKKRPKILSVSLLKLHLVLNQNWTNVWKKLVRKICTWTEINLRFQLWRTRVADPDSW